MQLTRNIGKHYFNLRTSVLYLIIYFSFEKGKTLIIKIICIHLKIQFKSTLYCTHRMIHVSITKQLETMYVM